VFVCGISSAQTLNFIDSEYIHVPDLPAVDKVFSIDVENDGDFDLIAGSYLKWKVFFNDGNNVFAESIDLPNVREVFIIEDVNNDQFKDLIVRNSNNRPEVIFFDSISNSYSQRQIIKDSSMLIHDMLLHDTDDDGDNDLLISFANDDHILKFENLTGFGHFGSPDYLDPVGYAEEGTFVDLDSDGNPDLISKTLSGYLNVNIASSDYSEFSWSEEVLPFPMDRYQIVDYDYDGDFDVAFVQDGILHCVENQEGVFNSFDTHYPFTDVSWFLFSDMENDSVMDVLIVKSYEDFILYKGVQNQPLVFEDSVSFHAPLLHYTNFELSFQDVNGDLTKDLLVASGSEYALYYLQQETDTLLFPNTQIVNQFVGRPVSSYFVDYDGDSDLDVLSFQSLGVEFSLYENLGDEAGFSSQIGVDTLYGELINHTFADYDQDGDVDVCLIAEMRHQDSCQILYYEFDEMLNKYSLPQIVDVLAVSPDLLESASINGDSYPDLVLYLETDTLRTIISYRYDSGWIHNPDTVLANVGYVRSLDVVDLNNDAFPELVCKILTPYRLEVAYNNNGAYSPFSSVIHEGLYSDIQIKDFNQDGYMDVIVNESAGQLFYLNNGFGEYSLYYDNIDDIDNNLIENEFAIADDFDTDGDIDIIRGRFGSNYTYILECVQEDTVFVPHEIEFVYNYLSHVDVGDLNSDGYLDLLHTFNSSIEWYENMPDISCEVEILDYQLCESENTQIPMEVTNSNNAVWQYFNEGEFHDVADNIPGVYGYSQNLIINQAFPEINDMLFRCIYSNPNDTLISDTVHLSIGDTIPPQPKWDTLPVITASCSFEIDSLPKAMDNCAGEIVGSTLDPVFYEGVGSYVVTWDYIDNHNNISHQNQLIIIDDNDEEPPVPAENNIDITVYQCNYQIESPPFALDNCDGMIQGVTTDQIDFSTTGEYIVLWTYSDEAGNITTQSQTIRIYDYDGPMPLEENLPQINEDCGFVLEDYPEAYDECTGLVEATTDDQLIFNTPGNYYVYWRYTDGNGNNEYQIQNISIVDSIAPVLETSFEDTIVMNCEYEITNIPVANDNCSGQIIGVTQDSLIFNLPGVYSVHWEFDDGNDNVLEKEQVIVIVNDEPPVPQVENLGTVTGICEVDSIAPPYAMSYCTDSILIAVSNVEFPITNYGTTIITWTFEDEFGNLGYQFQEVYVVDFIFPEIDCAEDLEVVLADSLNGFVVTDDSLDPLHASDNCDLAEFYNNYNMQSTLENAMFLPGFYEIVWTVEDQLGNSNSCTSYLEVTSENGISDMINSSFNLFPNPAREYFVINHPDLLDVNVTIFNLQGVKVVNLEKYKLGELIDISDFASGVYFVKVNGHNCCFAQKLTKL
jgi:hypothetical protein